MADLLAALRKASDALGGSKPPSRSLPNAVALSRAVEELQRAVDDAEFPLRECSELAKEVTHLSQLLTSLEPQLRRAVLKHGAASGAAGDVLFAALSAFKACAHLAAHLAEQGEFDASHHVLQCGVTLLLGPARLALRPPRGASARPLPSSQEQVWASHQLRIASKLLELLFAVHGAPGFEGCAAEVLPAEDTLRWLDAVSTALARGLDKQLEEDGPEAEFLRLSVMTSYASVCRRLLWDPAPAAAAAQRQAGAEADGRILGPGFPHLQAAVSGDTGLQRLIVQLACHGASCAAKQQAEAEEGITTAWLSGMHACFLLPAVACLRGGRRQLISRDAGRFCEEATSELLAVLPTRGLEAAAVPSLAGLWRQAGSLLTEAQQARLGDPPELGRSAPVSGGEKEAARLLWPLLPRLADVMQTVAEGGCEMSGAALGQLAGVLLARATAVGSLDEPEELQQLYEAAAGALRASVPFVRPEQCPAAGGIVPRAAQCAFRLWWESSVAARVLCFPLGTRIDNDERRALAERLVAAAPAGHLLLITGCRAAHHLSSLGPVFLESLLPIVASSIDQIGLLQRVAARLARTPRLAGKAERRATAVCAAAAEVYLLLADSYSTLDRVEVDFEGAAGHVSAIVSSLGCPMGAVSCVLTCRPQLAQDLLAAVPLALVAASHRALAETLAKDVSHCLYNEPRRLGRALLQRGAVRQLLRLVARHINATPAAEIEALAMTAKNFLDALRMCHSALAPASEGIARPAPPAFLAVPGTRQASASRPDEVKAAALRDAAAAVELADKLELLCGAADDSGEKAAEEAAHLQLAQAAATRCCAYLRCSNVAAVGGPDAGEGEGAKLCSACRVCWYCSPACQRLDWKEGGHKRMCRPLAEAKQRDRERRRIEAAGGQE